MGLRKTKYFFPRSHNSMVTVLDPLLINPRTHWLTSISHKYLWLFKVLSPMFPLLPSLPFLQSPLPIPYLLTFVPISIWIYDLPASCDLWYLSHLLWSWEFDTCPLIPGACVALYEVLCSNSSPAEPKPNLGHPATILAALFSQSWVHSITPFDLVGGHLIDSYWNFSAYTRHFPLFPSYVLVFFMTCHFFGSLMKRGCEPGCPGRKATLGAANVFMC